MILVEDQYVFKFSITRSDGVVFKDFIKEPDLKAFTLIEEAGNTLPTFELAFKTEDASIIPYLNEGNVLDITFGRSLKDENLVDAKFSILRLNYNKFGESQYSIYVSGLYAAIKYLSEDVIAQYPSISGVAAIKQVVDTYMTTDFNVTTSSDSQTWLRPNISAKAFVNQTWMHSYIKDSFIAIGIDSSGTMILRDMNLSVKPYAEVPQYNFTTDPDPTKITDVLYDGDYVVESNTGFMNYWMGYGREKRVYDFETGVDSDVLEEPSILLTNSAEFTRTSDIVKKTSEAGFTNTNVHANYWKAYHQNLQSLALFSSHKISFSFQNLYVPVKVLDVVGFSDIEINAKTLEQAGSSAGKYFVSKVSRTLSNRQFVTTVQLCRETINEVKGDLR